MSLLEQGLLILAHNIPVQDVVHCYKDGVTFEVEFMAGEGATIAVLTLSQHDIRPMHAREILHVRTLAETESADLEPIPIGQIVYT